MPDKADTSSQGKATFISIITNLCKNTTVDISKHLENAGILTPGGKANWSQSTVNSILRNEKYKGDALLQKTFMVNFLSKRKK
ncbi:MAG: recombinase family protein [Ethanoligenens sp.]